MIIMIILIINIRIYTFHYMWIYTCNINICMPLYVDNDNMIILYNSKHMCIHSTAAKMAAGRPQASSLSMSARQKVVNTYICVYVYIYIYIYIIIIIITIIYIYIYYYII